MFSVLGFDFYVRVSKHGLCIFKTIFFTIKYDLVALENIYI